MIYNTLICFGDSLTYGSRDEFGLSYPAELKRIITEEENVFISTINLGVAGETTADMLRRSYKEVKDYPDAKDIILLAGTNDARDKIPAKLFMENFIGLYNDFKVLKKRVFICTIPLKVSFGSPGYDWQTNDYIKNYNQEIKGFFKGKCPIIELEDLSKKCFIDGIHFNHKGNIEVANRVYKKIIEIR